MKQLVGYFLRGILILAPAALTVYIIYSFVHWIDESFDPFDVPGLGIALVVLLLTLVGFIGSKVRPFIILGERILHRVPVVNLIYSSIKDLFDAVLGDEQKFNQPVLVKVFNGTECYKLGFVTQPSMENINRPELTAVYFPDSYNISGELLLVPRENVIHVDALSSEVMKFVVSGGVARM